MAELVRAPTTSCTTPSPSEDDGGVGAEAQLPSSHDDLADVTTPTSGGAKDEAFIKKRRRYLYSCEVCVLFQCMIVSIFTSRLNI